MQKPVVSIGDTFERLTVISRAENYTAPGGQVQPNWLCRCLCGKKKIVRQSDLRSGRTRSCTCLIRQKTAERAIHGHARVGRVDAEYKIWNGMKARCNSPKATGYKYYGGRGIRVCERWNDFVNFLADMGRRPTPLHSVERKDNDGDYSPDNCKWATDAEQRRNRKDLNLLTHNGTTLCVADWAAFLKMNQSTLYMRKRLGWSDEKALTHPLMKNQHA